MMDRTHLFDMFKHGMDALSVGVALATLIQVLPAIAATLTIIWTMIRIWETDTVKYLTGRDD